MLVISKDICIGFVCEERRICTALPLITCRVVFVIGSSLQLKYLFRKEIENNWNFPKESLDYFLLKLGLLRGSKDTIRTICYHKRRNVNKQQNLTKNGERINRKLLEFRKCTFGIKLNCSFILMSQEINFIAIGFRLHFI